MRVYKFTMFLIAINLAILIINWMNVFPARVTTSANPSYFRTIFEQNLATIVGFGGFVIIGLMILTRSIAPLIIGVFSTVFWGGFLSALDILNQLGLSTTSTPVLAFIGIMSLAYLAAVLQIATGGWAGVE